jgi:hypothetical protein
MKNQYFGDVNDWRKYLILRRLLRAGLTVTVGWMLTPDDGSRDGARRSYLSDLRNRLADPELFDWLADWSRSGAPRDIRHIEASGLLAGARFLSDPIGDAAEERGQWFDRLARVADGSDLIFLDPDNGLQTKSVARGRRRSSKYVYWSEVATLLARGRSVMVYQHVPRMEPSRNLTLRTGEAFAALEITHCLGIRAAGVNYFIYPAAGMERSIRSAAISCSDLRTMGIDCRESERSATPLHLHRKTPSEQGTTTIGFRNRNRQRVLAKTDLLGTDHGQRVYVLLCDDCGHEYGANGSDIFQRRCPSCQHGRRGLAHRVE